MQELMNFATVLIVAVGIAGCIGVMYASGLRLWAKSGAPEGGDGCPNYLFRFASVACFAACVVVVLFCTVADDSDVPLINNEGIRTWKLWKVFW